MSELSSVFATSRYVAFALSKRLVLSAAFLSRRSITQRGNPLFWTCNSRNVRDAHSQNERRDFHSESLRPCSCSLWLPRNCSAATSALISFGILRVIFPLMQLAEFIESFRYLSQPAFRAHL